MRFRAVVFASAAVVLAFPAVAKSEIFSWEGQVGPGAGNGRCIYYVGQSACSGWNYWYQLNAANKSCPNGDVVFAGFQNNSTHRGVYLRPCESAITYPGDHSMGGYLKSGVTWCTWRQDCASFGGATVWFRTWA